MDGLDHDSGLDCDSLRRLVGDRGGQGRTGNRDRDRDRDKDRDRGLGAETGEALDRDDPYSMEDHHGSHHGAAGIRGVGLKGGGSGGLPVDLPSFTEETMHGFEETPNLDSLN
jgi:hypothetical protein